MDANELPLKRDIRLSEKLPQEIIIASEVSLDLETLRKICFTLPDDTNVPLQIEMQIIEQTNLQNTQISGLLKNLSGGDPSQQIGLLHQAIVFLKEMNMDAAKSNIEIYLNNLKKQNILLKSLGFAEIVFRLPEHSQGMAGDAPLVTTLGVFSYSGEVGSSRLRLDTTAEFLGFPVSGIAHKTR